MSLVLTLTLLGCGGGETPAPAPAAPSAAATAKPPAPAPAAAPAAAVGPDGPESISIPVIAEISTDAAVIQGGHEVWEARGCGGCHKFGEKLVGPDLKGVFSRRTTPWVERQITDPSTMIHNDPQAKALFATFMVEMPKQGVPEADLPKLIAYIKAQGG